MEKGPRTGSFPKPQPTGALSPAAALPPPQPFWGTKCHEKGLILSFLSYSCLQAPRERQHIAIAFPYSSVICPCFHDTLALRPPDPAASPEDTSTWLNITSNAERTFSEDETFGFYRERACSENCSINCIDRLKMLAESSRKAGKSLGQPELCPCRGWPAGLSVWLCSYNKPAAWLHVAGMCKQNMLESTNCSSVCAVPFPSPGPLHHHLRQAHVSAATALWWHLVQRQGAADFSPLPSWRGCPFPFIYIQEDSVSWSAFSKQEAQSFHNGLERKRFPDPMLLFIHVSGSSEIRKMWIQTLTLAKPTEDWTWTISMPGECSMDWSVMIKVVTTLHHCRWRNPDLLVWIKYAPRTPNKTFLEIQWLSRLRIPGGLKFSYRTAVGTCGSRSNPWATQKRDLQSVFVFNTRQQPKQRAGVLGSTVLD